MQRFITASLITAGLWTCTGNASEQAPQVPASTPKAEFVAVYRAPLPDPREPRCLKVLIVSTAMYAGSIVATYHNNLHLADALQAVGLVGYIGSAVALCHDTRTPEEREWRLISVGNAESATNAYGHKKRYVLQAIAKDTLLGKYFQTNPTATHPLAVGIQMSPEAAASERARKLDDLARELAAPKDDLLKELEAVRNNI